MSDWSCLKCGEKVPHNFMRCWNCGTGRRGEVDPYFPDTSEARRRQILRNLTPAGVMIAIAVWFVFSCIVVASVMWLTNLLPATFVNLLAGITVVFISGIMIGVTVNVMGELGTIVQRHFTDEDFAEVPVIKVRRDNTADRNEASDLRTGNTDDD